MFFKLFRQSFLDNKKRKMWDKQYADGEWEVLKSPLEEARFEAVRQFIYKYGQHKKVLEVGCGEGLLQAKLRKDTYTAFTGIDISAVAIRKAAHLQDATTTYLCADMEHYQPDTIFDIIIFTESLYYAAHPLQLMNRYMDLLAADGVMILSIYEDSPFTKLFGNITHRCIDETITKNSRGKWYCRVYNKSRK